MLPVRAAKDVEGVPKGMISALQPVRLQTNRTDVAIS